MNVEIAERLAARRKQAGLSQEALAEKLGVSRQAVSKWERSESSPDTDNLIALARLYGVSLDELLYVDDAIADDVAFEAEDRAGEGTDAAAAAQVAAAAAQTAAASAKAAARAAEEAHRAGKGKDAGHENKVRIGPGGIHVEDGEDSVHVSWRDGVHVVDADKGEEVHVGWDGVHVRGHGAADHVFTRDGSFGWQGGSEFRRTWLRFPFWLVVILAYLFVGVYQNMWGPGLFMFFTIPAYYVIGAAIDSRRIAPAICALYPLAVTAWFAWTVFHSGMWNPTWALFLTIPVVEFATIRISAWWQGRRARQASGVATAAAGGDIAEAEGASPGGGSQAADEAPVGGIGGEGASAPGPVLH